MTEQANHDKRLDELLDSALADYSNVEPRAGLEDRILANLDSAQAEGRSWLRWWPAFSFAGAAVIALLVFLAWPRETTKPKQVANVPSPAVTPTHVPPTSSTTHSHPPQIAEVSRLQAPIRAAREQPHTAPTAQPPQLTVVKQDVFPAPSPLTDQEKLLFSYMRRTPAAEIAANAKPDPPPALEQKIDQAFPGQRNSDSNTNTR